MDTNAFFESEFDEHTAVVDATRAALMEPFGRLLDIAADSIRSGGKILLFGNGGSAADCQHLATELTIRYKTDRAAIAAIALTTDTSALTACGNDLGFEELFARQVEALAKPGDLAIGISTSGQSENIIRGLKKAREMGAVAAGFGGKDGGRMHEFADPFLVVPSDTTARIQEMHITLGQMLCGALELELGLV
ncbi:MAG: D-sedoheptulose 7-phosphate isomerase [Rhodospirillaceae bacterium]|jgi:D-sedoheptulose 7-phosphate isomerase|nr:D-sedoheptulose 7-phosphate isomerase [Rhodospirillaceae bacterium]MBT3910814.1 D-sedoheptulose 7-phosphate isomerase [Rhodospirillaceae bacterium]MBT4751219.1 D-sedoheptulose 7-phosphate isomerase [Rhodospirillaceae bacterium]MBT5300053.1 D-sedoheptulose 7-phosphate isomerase [Rhodospirillaceae bacterium]MBT5515788.1 D-sedoheptulose 7-phosphate isomerase [Rhodospirillaceae bacterium]